MTRKKVNSFHRKLKIIHILIFFLKKLKNYIKVVMATEIYLDSIIIKTYDLKYQLALFPE